MKLYKYLLCLLGVIVLMSILRACAPDTVEPVWWMRIVEVLFYLSPALLVWFVERSSLKQFLKDYLFHSAGIDWRQFVYILIGCAILVPLLSVVLTIVAGHLIGMDVAGGLYPFGQEVVLFGISFDGASGSFWLVYVLWLLIGGLVFGGLAVLAEEIGWRGFLDVNWSCPAAVRPLLTGVVWAVFGLPFYVHGADFVLSTWLLSLVCLVALSYLLSSVVRHTGTVWASAAVRGVFSISVWPLPVSADGGVEQQIIKLLVVLILLALVSLLRKGTDADGNKFSHVAHGKVG